jgi:hypothetical protein
LSFSIPDIRPFFYQHATVYQFVFLYIDDISTTFLPRCYGLLIFVFLYTWYKTIFLPTCYSILICVSLYRWYKTIFLPICYGILIFVFPYIVEIVNFCFVQYTKLFWYFFFTISMIQRTFVLFNILIAKYIGICCVLKKWINYRIRDAPVQSDWVPVGSVPSPDWIPKRFGTQSGLDTQTVWYPVHQSWLKLVYPYIESVSVSVRPNTLADSIVYSLFEYTKRIDLQLKFPI